MFHVFFNNAQAKTCLKYPCQQQLVEPNANEYEWAMKFSIGIIIMPHLSEASCLQILGQAMNLNCLT